MYLVQFSQQPNEKDTMPTVQVKTHESKQCTPALPVVLVSTVSPHITDHLDGCQHCLALCSFQITLYAVFHFYYQLCFIDKGTEKSKAYVISPTPWSLVETRFEPRCF